MKTFVLHRGVTYLLHVLFWVAYGAILYTYIQQLDSFRNCGLGRGALRRHRVSVNILFQSIVVVTSIL